MQIRPYVDALQRDLSAVAGPSEAETVELVRRIGVALEASVRLRILEAVSEAAHELDAQLEESRVEVRLAAGDPSLIVVAEERVAAPPGSGEEGLAARITLRLPNALKAGVESAALHEGTSVNTWIVQALGRALDVRPKHSGRRLTGFARS